MKRILCILSSLDAGGAETFLMKLCRTLPENEYQFDFIVSVDNGCYTQELIARGSRIHKIPERTKDLAGAFRGIMSVVHKNKYDTVLKLGEHPLAVIDLIAAKLAGAGTLALRSCNAPTELSASTQVVYSLLRPLLNRIATVKLAPSEPAAEFMFGKNADVHILNNGLDLNVFHYDEEGRQRIRKEFCLDNALVLGHIGRFQHQKNHLFLLEIFNAIRQRRPDAKLLLIGTGALESQIREKALILGLQEHVIFAGQRFDIPQLLSAMDIFVFPSFHEGMPNTVIEAQATGLPCVIADTITNKADITGLVQFLPLDQNAEHWADISIDMLTARRFDTSADILAQGYDINDVAKKFLRLLGC